MATKTKADLRDSAMREIKKLANGEELSAEDSSYVEEKIDELHEELTELARAYWDTEEIPAAMMPSYTRVVAADIAGRYASLAEAQYFLALRQPAIQNMRRLTTRLKPPTEDERMFF